MKGGGWRDGLNEMKLIMVRPKIEEKKEGRKEDYFFASESIFPKQTEKRKKKQKTEQNKVTTQSVLPLLVLVGVLLPAKHQRKDLREQKKKKKKEKKKEKNRKTNLQQLVAPPAVSPGQTPL